MAFSPSSTVCWPISDPPVVSNVTVWRFGWGFWFSTHVAFKVMSAVTGRLKSYGSPFSVHPENVYPFLVGVSGTVTVSPSFTVCCATVFPPSV